MTEPGQREEQVTALIRSSFALSPPSDFSPVLPDHPSKRDIGQYALEAIYKDFGSQGLVYLAKSAMHETSGLGTRNPDLECLPKSMSVLLDMIAFSVNEQQRSDKQQEREQKNHAASADKRPQPNRRKFLEIMGYLGGYAATGSLLGGWLGADVVAPHLPKDPDNQGNTEISDEVGSGIVGSVAGAGVGTFGGIVANAPERQREPRTKVSLHANPTIVWPKPMKWHAQAIANAAIHSLEKLLNTPERSR